VTDKHQARQHIHARAKELKAAGVKLGEAGPVTYKEAIDAYVANYAAGVLMYHDGHSQAFALVGPAHTRYVAMAGRDALGYLVSDDSTTTAPGGRKTVFSSGAIYTSKAGPVEVTGPTYLAYEAVGESAALGFPTRPVRAIPGGTEQEFTGGRIYHAAGAGWAHSITGSILKEFLAQGGTNKLGFPLSDETPILTANGKHVGKASEFKIAAIYARTGGQAFLVRSDFWRHYNRLGGPTGSLGWPAAAEAAITGVAGDGRHQRFEHGTVLWFGDRQSMLTVTPFRLFIGRIDSEESDPWPGQGANDIYMKVTVSVGSKTVYNKRVPEDGDWSTGSNVVDVNHRIPVDLSPAPNEKVRLTIDVWEADEGGDDHLGKWTHDLSAATGWGLRENSGAFKSGDFSRINSITAAHQPIVDMNRLSATDMFWGIKNFGTPSLSHATYAAAFLDVDNESDWWDPTDWLDAAFFELVVEGLAGSGNCYGFSLEAIYSRKGRSLLSQPLKRFTTRAAVEPEVNVKHCYQVGAPAIWWFLGQFASGNTHDPKDVFTATRDAYNSGNNPVLCLTQNYAFTGAPHCVLPVAWDSTTKPWTMTISDSNFPQDLKQLEVDPDDNTFHYVGASIYNGGQWSGGRMHWMPFSVLSSRPRTPVWDAIVLILNGSVILVGDDAQTTSITDMAGNDLHGCGERALGELKRGRRVDNYFIPIPGFAGTGTIKGDLLFSQGRLPGAAPASAPTFKHATTARRAGAFDYIAKRGLDLYRLSSPLTNRETTDVDVDELGSTNGKFTVRPGKERQIKFETVRRRSVGRNRVHVTLEGLPATAGQGVEIGVRPGLEGIDVLPARQRATAQVRVESVVGKQATVRRFEVDLDGGTHLALTDALTSGSIEAGPISQAFGSVGTTTAIPANP
jgi:LGFP repeat